MEQDFTIQLPDGRKLSYKVLGDSSKQPIIYFHGFGSSAAGIYFDSKTLEKNNVYVIGVNRPGYASRI